MWALLVFSSVSEARSCADDRFDTTNGAIALTNLDHLIASRDDADALIEPLLMRAQLRADYASSARALRLSRSDSPAALLSRAHALAALHRFDEALHQIDRASTQGLPDDQVIAARARILVAVGRADEALASLQAAVDHHRDYASLSALAVAYAALSRFDQADGLYQAALDTLDTTLPFPYAWTQFARGQMWAEQAHDAARGEACYRSALQALPEFVVANIHLAELEAARGDLHAAIARLAPIARDTDEPEAWARLGEYRLRLHQTAPGEAAIARAHQRFDNLLREQPLAFADHAAEFYLGVGDCPRRARHWADVNLRNRPTARARELVLRATTAATRTGGTPRASCHTSAGTPK